MLEINPNFEYARSLTSTCLEASHQQLFFAEHLPRLSDLKFDEGIYEKNYQFLSTIIFNALRNE